MGIKSKKCIHLIKYKDLVYSKRISIYSPWWTCLEKQWLLNTNIIYTRKFNWIQLSVFKTSWLLNKSLQRVSKTTDSKRSVYCEKRESVNQIEKKYFTSLSKKPVLFTAECLVVHFCVEYRSYEACRHDV